METHSQCTEKDSLLEDVYKVEPKPNLKNTICKKCYKISLENLEWQSESTRADNNNYLLEHTEQYEKNVQEHVSSKPLLNTEEIFEDNVKCCICTQTISDCSLDIDDELFKSIIDHHMQEPEDEVDTKPPNITDIFKVIGTTVGDEDTISSNKNCETVVKIEPGTEEFNQLLGIDVNSEFNFDQKVKEECESLSSDRNNSLEIVITRQITPKGAPWYRCGLCFFASDRRRFLNHMKDHRKEAKLSFKCGECLHQTDGLYGLLNRHLPSHVAISSSFKCPHCPYEAKQQAYLRRHISTNHVPENTVFECSHCSFNTKHRTALLNHLLIHKDTTEVPMYKCEECRYQTKHKRYLNRHKLRHRSKSEVPTFSCDVCSYRAKRKDVIRGHMLNHINGIGVVYKCDICSFETKYKYNYRMHMQDHKKNSHKKL